MLDLTKPVRHRDNNAMSVKIIGQMDQSEDHYDEPMLIVVTTAHSGRQRVGYRHMDGHHPNGLIHFDLVNVNIGHIANIYHTKLNRTLAKALQILWRENQPLAVVEVIQSIDKDANQCDILTYFRGLFGSPS